MKNKILWISLAVSLVAVNLKSQVKNDDEITKHQKALYFFIEGKTLALNNNYIGAIENYRLALTFDEAPGIYHALSNVYIELAKFNEALIEINKALKLDPDNQTYLETLATIFITKKNFSKAISTYERILKLDSNYTYGLYTLARLYQEMNMPSKAIVIFEKITDKIGYDFDVLNKMYDIYISYKNYDKAAEVLESILELDPYNIEIKKLLSSLYIKNNEFDNARKVYEEIFTLNPDDKTVQTELVKIYFKQNESYRAFQNFSRMLGKDSLEYIEKVQIGELYYNLIAQDESAKEIAKNIFTDLNRDYPMQWIPYYYLGAIDLLNKNEVDYKENFQLALQNADTSREVYVNIGFSFYQQGQTDNALSVLDEGLLKFPDDFRLNYIKGLTLQRANREMESIPSFENAILANPNDANVLSILALAYDNQGMFSKSVETYEKALKIDPKNPLILNNYAYNLSERNENLDKALTMAKFAVENDPENASYLDTIGWIYFKLKNYKLAKKFIEKSVSINGNSSVVLEHLGDVYHALEDQPNALKFWKIALEKNPDNAPLKDKILSAKVG